MQFYQKIPIIDKGRHYFEDFFSFHMVILKMRLKKLT